MQIPDLTKPLSALVRPTTIIESARLNEKLGAQVTIASETFQHTGSFKFRAAYSLASGVPQQKIVAESSGNFGQALAYACKLLGKTCIIVMPTTATQVKLDSIKAFGGTVVLTDVRVKSRAERLREVAAENPDAFVASPFDHELVVKGNATLGHEICNLQEHFDYIIVPIGGGGLSSGIVQAIRERGLGTKVVGAEPLAGNDAARSFEAGELLVNDKEPQTLADGARTVSLGKLNWSIIKDGLESIIEVGEEQIAEGVRLLFTYANLKVEPTGALSIGAILAKPEKFSDRSICCVVSGGNVDPEVYAKLIAG